MKTLQVPMPTKHWSQTASDDFLLAMDQVGLFGALKQSDTSLFAN